MPIDRAGNKQSNALFLRSITGSQTIRNLIGGVDKDDFYSFTLNTRSSLTASLNKLSVNADLYLRSQSGQIVQKSTRKGKNSEFINTALDAGTYFIHVQSTERKSTTYTLSFSSTPIVTSSITVINPDGGNSLTKGNGYPILWNDTISENVRIDLLKNGTYVSNITPSTPSTGSFYWTVPDILTDGSDYKISVTSTTNADISDYSDTTFTINAIPYITLTSPNGGNNLTPETTIAITWEDNISENVKLDLYKSGAYQGAIDGSVLSNGSYYWTVPSNLPTGNDYQIRITSINNSNLLDNSNSYFTIAPPSQPDLAILNQTAPAYATVGSTINIGAYTQNNGTAESGYSSTRYWLSNDTILNPGSDVELGYNYVDGLSVGSSKYNAFNIIYNSAWGTGTKYILFQADGNSNVAESNEFNNVAYQDITINASGDWFNQNVQDPGLQSIVRSKFTDSKIDRNDMIAIFQNAKDDNNISSTELQDLRYLVNNSSYLAMDDYVRVLSNKVVNSDPANSKSGFNNLYGGSTATQLDNLVGKWFLGKDYPDLTTSSYTYKLASGSLFQNGISYTDINQGAVGNCYFLSGMANAALRSPSTIQSMFIDNGDDTFTVRFYNNGVADYVTVDKYLPTTSYGGFIYTHQSGSSWGTYNNTSNELWVLLAEKAYAQMNESGWLHGPGSGGLDRDLNSYKGIESGYGGGAIEDITGKQTSSSTLNSSHFSNIVNAWNSGKMIFFGSKDAPASSAVARSHGYTMVGYTSSTQKFRLYNPWGETGGYLDGEFKSGYIEASMNELVQNFGQWSWTTT